MEFRLKWGGGDARRLTWCCDRIAAAMPPRGGLILHLGCNNVMLSSPDCGFIPVDLDAWNHPDMIQADGEALPFRDKSVDAVLVPEVLEHTESPQRMLEECVRVARRIVTGTVPAELEWPDIERPQDRFPRSAAECEAEHSQETEAIRIVRKCAAPRHAARHMHRHFFDRPRLAELLSGIRGVSRAGAGRLGTKPEVFGFILELPPPHPPHRQAGALTRHDSP